VVRAGLADIEFDEAEVALAREMAEVGQVAGAEVVDADDDVSFGQKSVTQMRSEKPRGSCDESVSRH
jgi:hypothetical protein